LATSCEVGSVILKAAKLTPAAVTCALYLITDALFAEPGLAGFFSESCPPGSTSSFDTPLIFIMASS
jgi:hypothetical protein